MAYTLIQINDINNNKSAVYKQIYIDVNGFKWIGKPDGSLQNYSNTNPFTVEDDIVWIIAELSTKQDLLVSGVNIKTINGDSILGPGDIVISGGGGTWGSITGTVTDQLDLINYLVSNYEPLLGYTPVPETRTLTINGNTYDLSANRTWSITAGVSTVTGSAPISSSGGANPDISITQADSVTDGYLSSTDWNTFNNKEEKADFTKTFLLGGM